MRPTVVLRIFVVFRMASFIRTPGREAEQKAAGQGLSAQTALTRSLPAQFVLDAVEV